MIDRGEESSIQADHPPMAMMLYRQSWHPFLKDFMYHQEEEEVLTIIYGAKTADLWCPHDQKCGGESSIQADHPMVMIDL